MNTNTADRICRIFTTALSIEVPSTDADLFETGALDSLAFVELLAGLEQQFGLRITDDDLEVDNFRSIARIAEFVESRVRVTPLHLAERSGAR
jgi:methoxymalonate biosynthesis acyl carrier protein